MNNPRSDWLYHTQWGVFVDFLGAPASSMGGSEVTAEEWNQRTDAFDAKGLARQLHEMQAPYLFITLGQNSGHYCSPNAAYDRIVGHCPSKCSRRDLVADLYEALAPFGIKLLVYLPALGPAADVQALERLKCTPPWKPNCSLGLSGYHVVEGVDDRLTEFQRYWEAIIREWSTRWGRKICGWWVDGCYYNERLYDFPDAPNFKSFAAAMRAGNPDSIIAWNPGVKYPPCTVSDEEDYTAGEVNALEKVEQLGRWVKQAQFHVLTHMGDTWGREPIRYSQIEVLDYSRAIIDGGGVITWDVPTTPHGLIVEDACRCLRELGKAIMPRGLEAEPPQLAQTVCRFTMPYLAPEGGLMPGRAHITLHNRWSRPISGAVSLQEASDGEGDTMKAMAPVAYNLAPGEKREIESAIVWTSTESKKAKIRVSVRQSDGCRSAYYPMVMRKAIRLPLLPSGVRLDDLPQALRKTPAFVVCVSPLSAAALVDQAIAVIRLGMAHDRLCVWAQVSDALMLRTPNYWGGSCMEVFAAAGDGSSIGQLMLAPAAADKADCVRRVGSEGIVPVSQVEFCTSRNEKGYTGCAMISMPWLIGTDLLPGCFLLEIAVNAGVKGKFRRGLLFGEWGASGKTEGYGIVLDTCGVR